MTSIGFGHRRYLTLCVRFLNYDSEFLPRDSLGIECRLSIVLIDSRMSGNGTAGSPYTPRFQVCSGWYPRMTFGPA